MKKLVTFAMIGLTVQLNAQTFGNMPFSTPQISNPAFLALPELPQLNVVGKTGPVFNSTYIGYNQYAPKLKGSFGVYFTGLNANANLFEQYNKGNMGISYAKLFNLNETWRYSVGGSLDFSIGGSSFEGETKVYYNVGTNLGGVLYADKFFTSLSVGLNLNGVAQSTWLTGYKWQPLNNKDFSLTPMASVRYVAGRTYMEGNLNIAYKKFSVNLGYNYNAFNIGVGYDFKRFRLNYNIGKMFAPNSNGLYHEGGIQFKLSKSRQPQKTAFNHRLF